MQTTDLTIVGGGFSGLACAQAAALRGVNTLVLERKAAIGDRIHTTGILVKEIADHIDVPRNLTRKVSGVRLYSPNGKWIDLVSPGYYFLATDTAGMLRWQAERALEAGATIRVGTPFTSATPTPGGWVFPDLNLESRFLIGCDGAKSKVAEICGLAANRQYLVGVESEWEGIAGIDDSKLHVFLDAQLAPGYIGWIVPGVGIHQIGLAAHERLSPRLEPFIAKMQRLFDFSRAQSLGKRGGLIPCGGSLGKISAKRSLLLGDAAGTVSPLTAGGIHPALELGRLAGVALADHLLDGGPPPDELLRRHTPRYRMKSLLRQGFSRWQPPNLLYDLLLANPLFRRFAQTVFFHHRGLLSAQAWRDLTRTTP